MENDNAKTVSGGALGDSSLEIGKVADALAKAQADMTSAMKSATNAHFRNTYADLAAVWDAWRAVGPKNGLAIVQPMQTSNERSVTVRTILIHGASGQWIGSTLTMPVSKADAQAVGSAITYARRYALSALVGIAPEDDDGNAAANVNRRAGNEPPPRQQFQQSGSQRREESADLTDLRRMVRAANDKPAMDRARAFIRERFPQGNPERDFAIDAFEAREAELIAAAKRTA